jgi:hypothetical protein
MYDALLDGWTYFMFNLVFYLTRHRGKPRGMAGKRVTTDLACDAVWERLVVGGLVTVAGGLAPDTPFELHLDQTTQGAVVSARTLLHRYPALLGRQPSLH